MQINKLMAKTLSIGLTITVICGAVPLLNPAMIVGLFISGMSAGLLLERRPENAT